MKYSVCNLPYLFTLYFGIFLTTNVVYGTTKEPFELKNTAEQSALDYLFNNFDNFMFDADGVFWSGEKAIAGSADFFNLAQLKGKRVYIISNGNTTITKSRLKKHGFKALQNKEIEIVTPSTVLEEMLTKHDLSSLNDQSLKKRNPPEAVGDKKKVYLAGTNDLKSGMVTAGFNVVGVGAARGARIHRDEYHTEIKLNPEPSKVDAMIISMDVDFDMFMARDAVSYLKTNPKIQVFVSKQQVTKKGNGVYPGIESILALLKTTLPDHNHFEEGHYRPFSANEELIASLKKLNAKQVYLIGDEKLEKDLKAELNGIKIIGEGKKKTDDFYKDVELKEMENVAAIVFSIDFAFSMWKAREVLTYIQHNENLDLYATSDDHQMPPKSEEGNPVQSIFPDVGGILAFVKTALPEKLKGMKVLGKPAHTMLEYLLAKEKDAVQDYRTVFVGDSLDTDIIFGNSYKSNKRTRRPDNLDRLIIQDISTLFVLSGKHSKKDMEAEKTKGNYLKVPTFFAASLGSLLTVKEKEELKRLLSQNVTSGVKRRNSDLAKDGPAKKVNGIPGDRQNARRR